MGLPPKRLKSQMAETEYHCATSAKMQEFLCTSLAVSTVRGTHPLCYISHCVSSVCVYVCAHTCMWTFVFCVCKLACFVS